MFSCYFKESIYCKRIIPTKLVDFDWSKCPSVLVILLFTMIYIYSTSLYSAKLLQLGDESIYILNLATTLSRGGFCIFMSA